MKKLVISSENTRSTALRNLANELSERVGYRVWRVHPSAVADRYAVAFGRGIDKLTQLTAFYLNDVESPEFTTNLEHVPCLPGKKVVVRELLNSKEGKGITICNRDECTINAPLYTEFIPSKKEFRVHVWDNKVIDVQEKRRRNGAKASEVRNTSNGYVFCRKDVVIPDDLYGCALSAVSALERAYGGVDIIWNETRNKCYVLEVNQRPGLEGTTVKLYVDAIISKYNEENTND